MRSLLLVLTAGCAQPSSNDVVGPFTGAVHRYAVDAISLPHSGPDAQALGDDLTGDGFVDNQLGQLTATLFMENDLNVHPADLIASGAIASTVEVRADDLLDDPKVGVTYFGRNGAPAMVAGGSFVAGMFQSNRTRETHVPGQAIIRIPVFADADPSEVELDGVEIALAPAGDLGYDAVIRGGVPTAGLMPVVVAGIQQMLAANPADHASLALWLDANGDGMVSDDEIVTNSLIDALLAPDMSLDDGTPALSFGFTVHLRPAS